MVKINPVYELLPYFRYLNCNDKMCALDYQYWTLINEKPIQELYRLSTVLETMRMRIEWIEKDVAFLNQIIFN